MKRKVLKKQYRTLCKMLLGSAAVFGGMFANQHIAQAMPVINPADVRNNVNYNEIAKTVTGDVANGFLSWKDFSINKDELLTFSGMTNMLNYVDASLFKNPSLIYGSIDASAVPGNFYIVNPNGVLFGPNSSVVANDFYVSTRSLSSDDIDNYINNGNKADFDLFSEIAHINENGLKSSDIMGTYDIADGDVMFLGQVQANSLTIEGNTIQIRNTADVKKLTKPDEELTDSDEETTYKWNDAPILQGDEVNLYSYKNPEVGYIVSTDNLEPNQLNDDVVNNLEYKYFVADTLGDENMPNSANKLGWNAYAFENGIQTIDDYRLITSVEDLNLVNRSNSNKTEEAEVTVTTSGNSYTIPYNAPLDGYVSGKYMLGNDIDFTTDEYKDKLFTPLGYKMDYRDFENSSDLITFNGLNFKINGLKTDTSVTDAQGELAAQGLFSVFAGTIKNVRITNVNIDASSNSDSAVGGLIGGIVSPANENFETTIKNVSVNGTGITGTYAGGLVGNTKYGPSQKVEKVVVSEDYPDAQSDDYGYYILVAVAGAGSPIVTFENIENFAPVTSTSYKSYAGGIAGYVNGKNVSIINSMNQGAISSRSYAGGIFGYTHVYFDELNQNYEYATVNLNKVANMASVTSNMYAGGLLGFSHYDVGIYNSYNSGDIGSTSGNYNTSYAGGLAYYQLRTVENSFNTGKINALRGAAGLLAGNDSDSYVTTVKNSYNSGSVTASGENYGSAYGIAYKINSTASNIYNSGEITSTAKEYSDVAGIAYQLNGNVENVYNVGNITNESNSGYTAGISYLAYGNLKNVYNFGNITSSSTYIKGDSYVGGYYSKYGNTAGIVNVFSDATADNIFNFGTVKATKGFASGIFNKIYRANDNLTNIYNVGNVTGLSAVGIVNSVNYSTNFENVYNFGTITATGTEVEPDSNDLTYSAGDYASGILGNISEEINLKNVYNFGEIDSKNFGAGIVDNLGGSKTVTFDNVYNFAKVTGSKGAAGILRAQNKYYDEREEEYYSPSAVFKNIYNYGDITSANGLSAGIFGINLTEGESTFTDVYNLGTIKGTSAAGILNSSIGKITVNSAYNFGDVTATSTTGNAAGIIADVDAIADAVISSVYNEGTITGTNSYNIAPANVTGYTELESAEKPDTSIELDENVFDTTSKSSYSPSDTTNPEIDKAKVMNTLWTAFENIDMGGTNSELDSELVWRLYANPDNVTDKARQPLLSAFMQNVTVQRYNELDEAGKITPSSLVTVNESNVHKVHDSNGNVLYTRYKNSGQSVTGDIDEVDSSLVKSTVIDPNNATNFEIGNNNSFAEALIYSSQFGYNFQFDENSNDTWKESNDDKVSAAGTSPDNNAIYLKTAVVIEPTIINLSITAEKGEYKDNKFTVLANDEGKYYTVTSENTSDDLTTFLNILTSVVEVVDKDDEHKNTTLYIDTDKYTLSNPVTTTVDGETKTSYTITNKTDSTETYAIEKNSDGTFTYTDKANNTVYNITLTDGLITTYSDKDAEIKLASGTIENEELTLDKKVDGKDYTISGDDTIIGLLTDVLKVDANSEGTATALEFNNKVTTNNKVENADGTVTYNVTKGGKEYEFTKNTDGSYTYIDDKTNPLNIVTYTVTVDPGTLTYDVQIKVGNMTMEDDEVKSGGGYTVSSDNKGFIADLLSGKVSVIETDDGLNTTLAATNPSALTHSGNNYTYTATGGKTYNFTKNGNIYTYTADNGAIYEVTLEQGDVTKTYNIGITVSDGVYYISPNGEGTLSLDTDEGYTIEQSVGKDKFTNAFNVKYNDPADVTQ
ncbi:MAG: filamentous hemagglutinin N-terminal domain-containing protein, partial [Selenomonadaceae bacterium]|nr:filamentous hemagglutinin N-terminal domain-containing protein [Selenomonadaceae bacterium]